MYKRILVAIDATPTEENRSALKRTEQIGLLTGGTVYVLHVARGHIIPGDIIGGAGLGLGRGRVAGAGGATCERYGDRTFQPRRYAGSRGLLPSSAAL